MSPEAREQQARYVHAVRGAVIAQANFSAYSIREVSWEQMREAWMRLQRNGKPTPWDGLVSKASTRTGGKADLFLGSVPASSCGRDTASSGRRAGRRSEIRRGRQRVFIDEHRYYYQLDAGVETPMRMVDGPFTYTYHGQQIFSTAPERIAGAWSQPLAPPSELPSHSPENLDDYFGIGKAFRIDRFGRRWVLDSVDHTAARQRIQAYDDRVYWRFGRHEVVERSRPSQRYAPAPRDEAPARFTVPTGSWSTSCSVTHWDYSDAPLDEITTTLNERGRAVVSVRPSDCSGTMLDLDEHVLSATHCYSDSSGNIDDPDDIDICMFGNRSANASSSRQGQVDCYPADDIDVHSSWTTESALDWSSWDYVVITLASRLSSSNQVDAYMAMSQASDSVIDGRADHHRGYPDPETDCGANSYTGVNTSFDGKKQYYAFGEIESVMSRTVNFDTSTATGMSGGVHYYCPTGDCEDSYYITAVQSQAWEFMGFGNDAGPKASKFRDWVSARI